MSTAEVIVEPQAVSALRRFNRSFTPRIGVLEESFLDTGRPLAAARLLFEIGTHPADEPVTVQMLRHHLGVDSGYLSRLLRRLEDDGVVELRDDVVDARRRVVELTPTGRAEWELLDRRSDAIATELLAPLSSDQRAQLAGALTTADRLVRLASVAIVAVDPLGAAADAAMAQYFDELDQRFSSGFDGAQDHPAQRRMLAAPSGTFLLVEDRGLAAGCGGLQRIDDDVAEVKRMWIHPSLRGLGIGKRLLGELEDAARELGYRSVQLDTNSSLVEAIAMYEAAGYAPIERYNDNPYAQRWFRKQL